MGAAGGPGPQIKAGENGTKVSLWIPGFLVKFGARFVPDEQAPVRDLVRKLGSLRVYVVDGSWYERSVEGDDFESSRRALERDGYVPMMTLQSDEERVFLGVRIDKRERIRRLGVVVDDGESFVRVRLKCKLEADDFAGLMDSGLIDGLDRIPVDFDEAVEDDALATPTAL